MFSLELLPLTADAVAKPLMKKTRSEILYIAEPSQLSMTEILDIDRDTIHRSSSSPVRNGDTATTLDGSTLFIHFFVNDPQHVWNDEEMQAVINKGFIVTDWLHQNSACTGLSFSQDDGDAYYHLESVDVLIPADASGEEEYYDIAAYAAGYRDTNNNGFVTDDMCIELKAFTNGWQNVVVIFHPMMAGRSFAKSDLAQRERGAVCTVFPFFTDQNPLTAGTMIHEIFHMFSACEEYDEGGTCQAGLDCGPCPNPWLATTYMNENCEVCCTDCVPCVMKDVRVENPSICASTRAVIGWADCEGSQNPTIDVYTNNTRYFGGDIMSLTAAVSNPGAAISVDMYIVLGVYGDYFFWPRWTDDLDFEIRVLDRGQQFTEAIIEPFVLPRPLPRVEASFFAGLFRHTTYDLLSNLKIADFEFVGDGARMNVYFSPAALNGVWNPTFRRYEWNSELNVVEDSGYSVALTTGQIAYFDLNGNSLGVQPLDSTLIYSLLGTDFLPAGGHLRSRPTFFSTTNGIIVRLTIGGTDELGLNVEATGELRCNPAP